MGSSDRTPGDTAALTIVEVDPRGVDALALLREAAIEARALYPNLHDTNAGWPTNPPTPDGGTYLVAYRAGKPVACGALRPLDDTTAEVRRVFVTASARRLGIATEMLRALEAAAMRFGYTTLKLETGDRQAPAMALYRHAGFHVTEPFGEHVGDPTSLCFRKDLPPLR